MFAGRRWPSQAIYWSSQVKSVSYENITIRWGWGDSGARPPNLHLGGSLPKITWPWWKSSPHMWIRLKTLVRFLHALDNGRQSNTRKPIVRNCILHWEYWIHERTYIANFFGRCGTDPLPNQIVPLDNTKQMSNGIANLFSIRELHPTHSFEHHPLFEDVITGQINIARRRRTLLLALGGPGFAHGHPLWHEQIVRFTLIDILLARYGKRSPYVPYKLT